MKNKKNIVIISIIGVVGLVLVTFAYFSSSSVIDNLFHTAEYGTTITEEFVSPPNWVPGAVEQKRVYVTNTGDVPVAVRISYTESWTSLNGDNLDLTFTKEGQSIPAAILAFGDNFLQNWVKSTENGVDYYYYNTILESGESTTDFLKSVTFNENVTSEANCENTNIYDQNTGDLTGVEQTCTSGDGYDGGTYNLTLTIQTVQSSVYKTVWNTNYEIGTPVILQTGVQYLLDNATNEANTAYSSETKGKMFVFTHGEAPNQVTETRYIGDDPNNYVYFNCDDMSDQSASTCEVWRILGVFDVDDGTGNVEQRIKLVRGSDFATNMVFNSSYNNDWTISPLKTFLNGDYYNRTGDAATYGLKASAKNIIDNAVFYLGASTYSGVTTEQLYANERGTTVCGACNSDTTKLTWTGFVGLMYPSDEYMVYGNGVNATCYDNPNGCSSGTNAQDGWVYKSNVLEGQSSPTYTWFLSSNAGDSFGVLFAGSAGGLNYYHSGISYGARPVVYLKSDIKISEGTGEVGSPYKLYNY